MSSILLPTSSPPSPSTPTPTRRSITSAIYAPYTTSRGTLFAARMGTHQTSSRTSHARALALCAAHHVKTSNFDPLLWKSLAGLIPTLPSSFPVDWSVLLPILREKLPFGVYRLFVPLADPQYLVGTVPPSWSTPQPLVPTNANS